MTTRKTHLLASTLAVVLAAAPSASQQQQGSTQSADRSRVIHVDAAGKETIRNEVTQLEGLLQEADAGKRDDHDKYVILFELLIKYGVLNLSDTPKAQTAQKEWDALLVKHPEWKSSPPQDMNLHEYHDAWAREVERQKQIEEKAKTWVPQDASPVNVFHDGRHLAAVYQYRIEFYEWPAGVECYALAQQLIPCASLPPGGVSFMFKKNGQTYDLKPFKVITFAHPIWSYRPPIFNTAPDIKIIALATSPFEYQSRSTEEVETMKAWQRQNKRKHWIRPNADFNEFYGVLSTDGKILAQVPFKMHLPDRALEEACALPDGSMAAFLIRTVEQDELGPAEFDLRHTSGVIVWTPDNGLRTLSADAAKNEFPILKKWDIVP